MIPFYISRDDSFANLQLLCLFCHRKKSNAEAKVRGLLQRVAKATHQLTESRESEDEVAKATRQLTESRESEGEVAPLSRFLTSGRFIFNQSRYRQLRDFRECYAQWRKENGLDIGKWNKDHYEAIFVKHNLRIELGTKKLYDGLYDGQTTTTMWIVGLDYDYNYSMT